MLLGLWQPSQAAEFLCAAGDVACLSAAMQAANANGEVNTITLEAGLYTLTAVDNDTDGPTGLPSVTSALTLRGAGAGSTIIERTASAPRFRLGHVALNGTLTVEGLTLQGGDFTSLPDGGGGLRNRGTLTIADSILSGNVASSGGGGIALATQSGVTLTNSSVGGNLPTSGGGVSGGLSFTSVSIMWLQNTILAGNWVPPTRTGSDCTSPGFSYGHNLIGDPTGCLITWEASDVTSDPGFGTFTDTGLPAQGYVPLHPESPAIDAMVGRGMST
jgi:parallel beta-helix repeat protein